MSFAYVGISCPRQTFNVANISFIVIWENKNLARISECTVIKPNCIKLEGRLPRV